MSETAHPSSAKCPNPGREGEEAGTRNPAGWTCLQVFQAAPIDRIGMIKSRASARWALSILRPFTPAQVFEVAGVSSRTIKCKAALDEKLSIGVSERLFGMAGLIGQVETMVEESGEPGSFDAARWLAVWLTSPLPAFGGVRPIEHMDTMEGRHLVSRTLARMQSGAFA